jgi:hypothetical protein
MQLLFRLPLTLLEMALRRGLRALLGLTGFVRGDEADDLVVPTTEPAAAPGRAPSPAAAPAAPAAPASPPPPTAEEAIARRRAREAAAANGGPAPAPAPASSRPRPIHETHVDREAEVVESFGPAEDVVATIQVDEPWDGYDGMPATAIVTRLRGADPATKGVVRMYEQQHKRRATVLRATG